MPTWLPDGKMLCFTSRRLEAAEEHIDSEVTMVMSGAWGGSPKKVPVEAGILDSDYLIIRQQNQASNGDIVVAMMEEANVKRIYFHSDHIELRLENSSVEPFHVSQAQILGKVVGLIRNI